MKFTPNLWLNKSLSLFAPALYGELLPYTYDFSALGDGPLHHQVAADEPGGIR